MGLLCDYFAAPDDDAAAATVDWVGGPAHPGKGAKRGLLRREPSPAPLVVVDMKDVEPTVQMATLEEILTGRPYDEIVADPTDPVVASRDGGERVVTRLTKTLQTALAEATDEQLGAAVDRWAGTDEFWGRGEPAVLRPAIGALAGVARAALANGHSLYCWVCV